MIKFVCDSCGKMMGEDDRCYVSYTGGNVADLCKGCFEEFLNWMKNKLVENKPNENYERVAWDGKSHIALL